jgi:hypothetical protein
LEEIKHKIGSLWDKKFQSIYVRLETLLRQKLGPADFYVQLDETSFLVSMPSTTEEESQVFCIRVAHELHTSLLGRCDVEQLKIARATRLEDENLELEEIAGAKLTQLAQRAGLPIRSNGRSSNSRSLLRQNARPAMHGPTHSHRFMPMWNMQKEAITTYRVATINDQPAIEGAMPDETFRTAMSAMLSRIRAATSTLADNLAAGRRLLMLVPISYDLLSTPIARMEVTAICRGLSGELRPYLMFEIGEMPNGVPQSRLSELVSSLKPFCRGVLAHLSANIQNFDRYQGTGLHAIGLSSFSSSGNANESDGEHFEHRVVDLCIAARRLHIMSFVLDIPNVDLLRSARDFGVSLASGFPIGPALVAPEPVRRLSFQEIEAAWSKEYSQAASVPRTGTEG